MKKIPFNNSKSYSSNIFQILLWFLPIITLNLGYIYITNIDQKLQNNKIKEAANSELQTMAYASDFSFQLLQRSKAFNAFLKTELKQYPQEHRVKYIKKRIEEIFDKQFPNIEIHVYQIENSSNKCKLIYKNIEDKKFTISPACKSFEYMHKVNSTGKTNIKDEKMLRNFFNSTVNIDELALNHRGKVTYSIYKLVPQRFVWNYITTSNNDIFGFFIFSKYDISSEIKSKLSTIKKLKEKSQNDAYLSKATRAFIPLFEGYGDVILQNKEIADNSYFKNFKNSIKITNATEARELEFKDYISSGNFGKNYKWFSYLGLDKTHLSLLIIPNNKDKVSPWLYSINIIYCSILLLLIINYAVYNKLPQLKLKFKFLLNFTLASILPLGLLITTAYGYILESEEAEKLILKSRLQNNINQFDIRKKHFLNKYKTAVNAAINDKRITDLLKKLKPKHNWDNKEINNKLLDILYWHFKEDLGLPILNVYLLDNYETGLMLSASYDQNGKYDLKRDFKPHDFTKENEDTLIRPITRSMYDQFRKKTDKENKYIQIRPITESRHDQLDKEPEIDSDYIDKEGKKVPYSTEEKAFKIVSGYEYNRGAYNLRGNFIFSDYGDNKKIIRCFNYLPFLNGKKRPQYAILIVWYSDIIDEKAYKDTKNIISLSNDSLKQDLTKDDFSIISFTNNIESLIKTYPDEKIQFPSNNKLSTVYLEQIAKELAEDAILHKIETNKETNNIYFFAKPSKELNNIVLVGACDLSNLLLKTNLKRTTIIIIMVIAILTVWICSYITTKIILNPISTLTSALNLVSSGNININIVSESKDELGVLCKEFSSMTNGLRERKKLSTLISDQAMNALSQGSLKTETFKGVALVSDIRNFTGTCEKYDAQFITELLNKHFAEMTAIISEHGGRIYKYIGDAIEAVFPEDENSQKSAALRSFEAGTKMLAKLKQINKEREKNNLFTYRIGIGLKYGEMYSGTLGSIDTRLDYAILGEPLKIAAKLEAVSIRQPDFPLVLDEHIQNELLQNKICNPIKLDNFDYSAYIITDDNYINNIIKEKQKELQKQKINISRKENITNILASSKFKNSYSFTFLSAFIVLTLGLLYGVFSVSKEYIQSEKERFINIQQEKNLRLLEQMTSEKSAEVALENIYRDIVSECENMLDNKASSEELRNKLNDYCKIYNIKKYVVKLNTENKYILSGLQESWLLKNTFKELESYNIMNLNNIEDNNLDENSKEFFNHVTKVHNNEYSKLILCHTRDNLKDRKIDDEYAFWDFLIDKESSKKQNKLVYYGIILLSKEINNPVSEQQFINSYSKNLPNTYISIKRCDDKNSKWIYSENYNQLRQNNNTTISTNDLSRTNDLIINKVKLGQNSYELNIETQVPNNTEKKLKIIAIIISLTLIYIYILSFKITYRKSFVNESLKSKLWINLLIIAVIPIVTPIILYHLYSFDSSVVFSHRLQSEMRKFSQNFGQRNNSSYPYHWQKIHEISSSEKAIQIIEENKNEKDNIKLSKYFSEQINKKMPYNMAHYKVRSLIISSPDKTITLKEKYKSYNQDLIASDSLKQNDRFMQLLSGITKTASNISPEKKQEVSNNKDNNFAEQTIMEEGLNILRKALGSDFYIKLSHSMREPVLLGIGDTQIALYCDVIPSLKNSKYATLWTLYFEREFPNIGNKYNINHNKKMDNDYTLRIYICHNRHYGMLYPAYHDINLYKKIKILSSYTANYNSPIYEEEIINGRHLSFQVLPCLVLPIYNMITTADYTPFINSQFKKDKLFYLTIFISLIIILFMASNIANDILQPINQLICGMKEANKENYSYKININRNDELGILCSSFNSMMRGLEEKFLMGKMVSDTAQKITLSKNTSSYKAECVIMYTTVVDFVKYSKEISPINIINELRQHVTYIARTVLEEGGEIDKIMAEKQLIAFHTDNKSLSECINSACNTAKKLLKLESNGTLPFPIAIGISHGQVVTGFLGVGEKRDFTIIGDPVNVAARIASYAEKQTTNRQLVSEDVFNFAKDNFTGQFIGEISLKGKSQAMKVYNLT